MEAIVKKELLNYYINTNTSEQNHRYTIYLLLFSVEYTEYNVITRCMPDSRQVS